MKKRNWLIILFSVIIAISNTSVYASLDLGMEHIVIVKHSPGSVLTVTESRPVTLNYKILCSDTIDDSGISKMSVKTSKPLMVNLTISKYPVPIPLYLFGREASEILITSDSVVFKGSMANENYYLYLYRLAYSGYINRSKFMPKTEESAEIRLLDTKFSAINEKLWQDPEISNSNKQLLLADNSFFVADLRKENVLNTKNEILSQKYLPDSLTLKNFKLEERFIDLGLESYSYLLHHRLPKEIFEPNIIKFIKAGYAQDTIVNLLNELIAKSNATLATKDYLLAKSNLYFLNNLGINKQTSHQLTKYLKVPGRTSYKEDLRGRMLEMSSLQPGQPFPAMKMIDLQGQTVSLANLKGKVLYIDIWATWCKPCIAEFPFSKQLVRSFNGSNNVEFVYLSIDEDISKWKSFISRNPDLNGFHVNQQPDNKGADAWDILNLAGIPKYIIVDTEGNVVTMNASRPSDKATKTRN